MPDVNPRQFVLRDFMPYLFARVGSLMERSFAPAMKTRGLTIDPWRVLMVLHFNGPATLIDLSRTTGVKTPTLSRMIGRMIDDGLISRRRSNKDSRTVEIRLRRKGEQVFQDLWPMASGLAGLVTAPFSDAEVAQLRSALRTIENVLVDQVGEQERERKSARKAAS